MNKVLNNTQVVKSIVFLIGVTVLNLTIAQSALQNSSQVSSSMLPNSVASLVINGEISIDDKGFIVNPNNTANFGARVFLDRAPSGAIPTYRVGESVRIGLSTTEDAYVYLFAHHPNGTLTQVLPNLYDGHGNSNYIQANHTYYFPNQDSSYSFDVTGPLGYDTLFLVASKEALTTGTLARFNNAQAFTTTYKNLDDFNKTIANSITAIEQSSWVTSSAVYYIIN